MYAGEDLRGAGDDLESVVLDEARQGVVRGLTGVLELDCLDEDGDAAESRVATTVVEVKMAKSIGRRNTS